jgi:hypothetical protein
MSCLLYYMTNGVFNSDLHIFSINKCDDITNARKTKLQKNRKVFLFITVILYKNLTF